MKTEKQKFNWVQICIILQVSERNRAVIEKKYNDQNLSEEDWTKLLKKDNLV